MLYNFLNSNFFQTLVLIATVVVTICLYYKRKRTQVCTAVTILMLQIKDIEKNIEHLLAEGIVNGVIQEKPLHYSSVIFEENNWTKYSYLIVGKVSQLAFENIDNFFKVAQRIREQQLYIKNRIQQSMDYKGMYYYNGIYTRVNTILDRAHDEKSDISKQKDICDKEIAIVHSLYGDPITNVPSFLQLELVFGLEKTLKQYHKLTDRTAYSELEKLKK